jgi:hypothetical protein
MINFIICLLTPYQVVISLDLERGLPGSVHTNGSGSSMEQQSIAKRLGEIAEQARFRATSEKANRWRIFF